jgi:hypothetical protein
VLIKVHISANLHINIYGLFLHNIIYIDTWKQLGGYGLMRTGINTEEHRRTRKEEALKHGCMVIWPISLGPKSSPL